MSRPSISRTLRVWQPINAIDLFQGSSDLHQRFLLSLQHLTYPPVYFEYSDSRAQSWLLKISIQLVNTRTSMTGWLPRILAVLRLAPGFRSKSDGNSQILWGVRGIWHRFHMVSKGCDRSSEAIVGDVVSISVWFPFARWRSSTKIKYYL